jgi:hypothetical protein
MSRPTLAALIVLALLFSSSAAFGSAGGGAAGGAGGARAGGSAKPEQVLVRFRTEEAPGRGGPVAAARQRTHERAGGKDPRPLRAVPGLEVVEVPSGTSAEVVIERYEADPNVLYAETDAEFELAQVPNDTLFGQQWALSNAGQRGGTPGVDIGVLDAWDYTRGSEFVTVAVIDTGIENGHADLAGRTWPGHGYDFHYDQHHPYDAGGHGTHVAGIIAACADDGFGMAGVAPEVLIMDLKVFSDQGGTTTASVIIEAIAFANENGARVINASWGSSTLNLSLLLAIEQSPALFIAASGNSAEDTDATPFYPASWSAVLDNVLSVAATTPRDDIASFSNFGSAIDIGAPGVDIVSTAPGRELVIYHDDFSDPDVWVAEFENTNRWGLSDVHFTSTPSALADSPGGDYANGEDSAIRMLDPISVWGLELPRAYFHMLLDTESGVTTSRSRRAPTV